MTDLSSDRMAVKWLFIPNQQAGIRQQKSHRFYGGFTISGFTGIT